MSNKKNRLVLKFEEIGLGDVSLVGGKNASLGELYNSLKPLGVEALGGFATTAKAFQDFLDGHGLRQNLTSLFARLNLGEGGDLDDISQAAREMMLATPLPEALCSDLIYSYVHLCTFFGNKCPLAVRSSATAEDLPGASFAGQHESYLNISGSNELIRAVHHCFASLFTSRAIDYRARHGFDQMSVSLSVGVQPMVDVGTGASGVMFTLDPDSGHRNVVVISGSYGLGEYLVQGVIVPDEWTVFKPTLDSAKRPIIARRLGSKEKKLVPWKEGTHAEMVSEREQKSFCLPDEDVCDLARWACLIEQHYSEFYGSSTPMDIEWAKDGRTGKIFVIQARPETVYSGRSEVGVQTYTVKPGDVKPILIGQAVGEKATHGTVRVVDSIEDADVVQDGDVLVTKATDPDWEPVLKRVAAIITDEGGRTSHAAIVAREIGVPCIVGTVNGTKCLQSGDFVTVSCAEGLEGKVYPGQVDFSVEVHDYTRIPITKTQLMLNVGNPGKAFALAGLPSQGVGLARIEFIITNEVGMHPMALVRYPHLKDQEAFVAIQKRIGTADPKEFFVAKLADGISRIAAAFYPRPVIVRTSDFKTNEYERLLGGFEFEVIEENPMLGFRGASRYYDPRYEEGFALECAALKRVRDEMGLTNLKVMIPFCRTVAEGKQVLETMAKYGLRQGENGLEVYAMCEVPSNVLLAEEFLAVFDGFSIGSNDLTQLVLGIDRDSGTVAHLFDERNAAVKKMIGEVIAVATRLKKPIGICGQAPSDYPDFAAWLVEQGINSISLNPDSLVRTLLKVAEFERAKHSVKSRPLDSKDELIPAVAAVG